jgi:hypothetical protein
MCSAVVASNREMVGDVEGDKENQKLGRQRGQYCAKSMLKV